MDMRFECGNNHINILNGGNISASSPIVTGSDKRLKKNIKDIDASDLIDIINVKSFDYKNGVENQCGVIAQDFIGTAWEPYVIKKTDDGYYAVNYNTILMALVSKVQQQDKKIVDLSNRLSEIEKRNQVIENAKASNT